MSISCEIHLNKPPNWSFYCGEEVSGTIKYDLDEPLEIERITISLKGLGYLRLTERSNRRNRGYTFGNSETYVNLDEVIHAGKATISAGSYERNFNFKLPQNIPPSFDYYKEIPGYGVNCNIGYYVRIKFEKPGWFAVPKRFRKDITVASTITCKLPIEPTIYGERRKLRQLFSSKTNTVIMKANILNSVIPSGGKIEIRCEIQNDTNVTINFVEIKLIEVHTFKTIEIKDLKAYADVPNCASKTASIESGATQNIPIDIVVPSNKVSLDNSCLVSRDYIVKITADMPMPHKNIILEIPVQISDDVKRCEICDAPPSYWEAMGEARRDDSGNCD